MIFRFMGDYAPAFGRADLVWCFFKALFAMLKGSRDRPIQMT
jgi:hypothetical protein